MGRPSSFSPELGTTICAHIAEGLSLRKIEKMEGMPSAVTVYGWLLKAEDGDKDYEAFFKQYTRARELQADVLAEETLDIADDDTLDIGFDDEGKPFVKGENIQRSRLKVDARRWYAGKVRPKKYGDKQSIEHSGPNGDALQLSVKVTFGA